MVVLFTVAGGAILAILGLAAYGLFQITGGVRILERFQKGGRR